MFREGAEHCTRGACAPIRGFTNARKHLQELGTPEPQLPPFDASKFESMHSVELNPKFGFRVIRVQRGFKPARECQEVGGRRVPRTRNRGMRVQFVAARLNFKKPASSFGTGLEYPDAFSDTVQPCPRPITFAAS